MILFLNLPTWNHLCILHVCGDDLHFLSQPMIMLVYSPRMWRWSWVEQNFKDFDLVFSTYVEMILGQRFFASQKLCILHVCGDDPWVDDWETDIHQYSPRMWRWSSLISSNLEIVGVFSTYVEMILVAKWTPTRIICILHVCGDDPNSQVNQSINQVYSPRMWRWSSLKERQLC